MKHYYIMRRDFYNVYDLAHVEAGSETERQMIEKGWERITRKDAIRRCREERLRRIYESSSAGYAPSEIYPYGVNWDKFPWYDGRLWTTNDGYVYELINS